MRYVQFAGFHWLCRDGDQGHAFYSSENVSLVGRRIRLACKPGSAAGVLLDRELGYGTHTLIVTGRLFAGNLATIFTGWIYDEDSKQEFDIEIGYCGDQHHDRPIHLGIPGRVPNMERDWFPIKPYEKWKFIIVHHPDKAEMFVEGWHVKEKKWKRVAWFSEGRKNHSRGRFRASVWQVGNKDAPGTSPGVATMYMEDYDFEPYAA